MRRDERAAVVVPRRKQNVFRSHTMYCSFAGFKRTLRWLSDGFQHSHVYVATCARYHVLGYRAASIKQHLFADKALARVLPDK